MFRTMTTKTAAMLLAAAALAAALAHANAGSPAAPNQRRFDPPPFDGRVGQVSFRNTSAYPVTVTIWHSDARAPHQRQTIAPGETYTFINGQGLPTMVSNCWGISVGNSPVKPLEQVADWDGAFEVSADTFWQR